MNDTNMSCVLDKKIQDETKDVIFQRSSQEAYISSSMNVAHRGRVTSGLRSISRMGNICRHAEYRNQDAGLDGLTGCCGTNNQGFSFSGAAARPTVC